MPLSLGKLVMRVGDVDRAGRRLVVIAREYVLKRSRQHDPVAVCVTEGCSYGEGGTRWQRFGKNAMGVGSRHAAAYQHRVVVTREMVTEYDAETPSKWRVAP